MNKHRVFIIFFLICVICSGVLLSFGLQKRSMHTNGELSKKLVNLLDKYDEKSSEKEQDKKEEDTKETDTGKSNNDVPLENIQLPLVRSVQENDYFCGPASLQMVLRYKGIDKTQTELANDMNTHPVTGTEYVDLAKTANRYIFHHTSIEPNDIGYHVQTLTRYDHNPEISDTFEKRVRQDISTQDPVFVAVDMHALYSNMPSTNHFIVIIGYALSAGTDDISYYYYIDPYNIPQEEQIQDIKTVSKETLMQAMIVNIEPAYIW